MSNTIGARNNGGTPQVGLPSAGSLTTAAPDSGTSRARGHALKGLGAVALVMALIDPSSAQVAGQQDPTLYGSSLESPGPANLQRADDPVIMSIHARILAARRADLAAHADTVYQWPSVISGGSPPAIEGQQGDISISSIHAKLLAARRQELGLPTNIVTPHGNPPPTTAAELAASARIMAACKGLNGDTQELYRRFSVGDYQYVLDACPAPPA